MKSGLWTFVSALVVALLVCGTALFISSQYNQTQKDIAQTQAQAQKESAAKISDGLDKIGKGVCQTGTRQFLICN